MESKWNYVKLLMFFGFNLWHNVPELDPVMDREDEKQWDEWHKEATRIFMQFGIEGVATARQIQNCSQRWDTFDWELILRYRRDEEQLENWNEYIFTLQYESHRHGEDWFKIMHGVD